MKNSSSDLSNPEPDRVGTCRSSPGSIKAMYESLPATEMQDNDAIWRTWAVDQPGIGTAVRAWVAKDSRSRYPHNPSREMRELVAVQWDTIAEGITGLEAATEAVSLVRDNLEHIVDACRGEEPDATPAYDLEDWFLWNPRAPWAEKADLLDEWRDNKVSDIDMDNKEWGAWSAKGEEWQCAWAQALLDLEEMLSDLPRAGQWAQLATRRNEELDSSLRRYTGAKITSAECNHTPGISDYLACRNDAEASMLRIEVLSKTVDAYWNSNKAWLDLQALVAYKEDAMRTEPFAFVRHTDPKYRAKRHEMARLLGLYTQSREPPMPEEQFKRLSKTQQRKVKKHGIRNARKTMFVSKKPFADADSRHH